MFKHMHFGVLILCVALLSACGGAEDRKAKYIEEAQERFEAKDYDKAKLGFKNAIQIDPKDPEPRIGLAKVFVAEKNWRQAAGQYQGALLADPESNEAAIELGKVFLLARGTEQAMEQANNVLSREPENVDALTLKAGAMIHRGESEQAHELLASLSARAPDNHDTAILYATSLSNRGERVEALKVVDVAIESNPDANDLLSMKALILNAMGETKAAKDIYLQLIAKNPESFLYKQRYITYLLQLGETDDAETVLNSFVEAEPDNIDLRKALVDMLVAQKKVEKASAKLDQYITKFPDENDFKMGLARLKLLQNEKAEALSILESIIAQDVESPDAANAELEIAKVELAEGKVDLVKERLDKVLTRHATNSEALLLRGRIALQENRNTEAVNDFRSVLANDPDDVAVTRLLAQAHAQAREFQLAENYFKQLAHRFPRDASVRNALAAVYQAQGATAKAIQAREELQSVSPNNSANLIELSKLYIAAQQFEKLSASASRLKNVGSEQAAASGHYFAGIYHQSQQQHEDAVDSFDQALILTPNAIEPLSAKVKSLIVLDRQDDAEVWLKQLIDQNTNVALANNLLGELLLFGKEFERAREHLTEAISASSKWIVPRKNLAISYRQEGNVDQAIAVLKESLTEIPEAASLRVDLAQLYEANENIEGAITQYELLTQTPNAPLFAANNLAMLLVTYKDDEASLKKATQVAEVLRGQDNPNFLDTLGWVYYKNAQYDLALPLIKEASRKSPDNPQITYHLAKTFKAKEDIGKAKEYFEKALSSERSFVGRQDAEEILKQLAEQG